RFHVLPLREISDSRDTTPATIHCCSVASSRHVLVSPFSSRTCHWRSEFGPDGMSLMPSLGTESARGALLVSGCFDDTGFARVSAAAAAPAPPAMPTFVLARLRILNMCPQLVHLTVTP